MDVALYSNSDGEPTPDYHQQTGYCCCCYYYTQMHVHADRETRPRLRPPVPTYVLRHQTKSITNSDVEALAPADPIMQRAPHLTHHLKFR